MLVRSTPILSAGSGKPGFIQFTRKVSSIVDRFAPTDEELASFFSIPQSALDHKKYSAPSGVVWFSLFDCARLELRNC